MENLPECPACGEKLDFLDTITYMSTSALFCHLYVCHNEECESCDQIYNDKDGELSKGDPSGIY